MSARIAVLLVDDHPVVREGYRRLLEDSGRIHVIGEASSASEAFERYCALQPDVVVMDLALPGASGLQAIRRILAHRANARVLVFSMHEEAIFARRSLDAGAAGYMTKASAPGVLVEAVETVAAGKRYLSHDVAQALALAQHTAEASLQEQLSAREFEVLELLVQGCTIEEIARRLSVNPKTVANHQSSIKQKLNVETSAQLFRVAMRFGLVPPA